MDRLAILSISWYAHYDAQFKTFSSDICWTSNILQLFPEGTTALLLKQAVFARCLEHAVFARCLEHAVFARCLEHAVFARCLEHAVFARCLEHAVLDGIHIEPCCSNVKQACQSCEKHIIVPC